jgi:hypothetical protein
MRQRALDAIPAGAKVNFKAPLTLAAWQSQGSYTITSTSSKKFTMQVASTDFGGALLSDAAFHLDHALEHQVTLMNSIKSGQWSSPAWQVVTFYYWSYYVAMAFTRMLGETVWFVTPDVASQFSRLAPSGSATLTKGTYEIACGSSVSAGFREVLLTGRSRRVHEQLWTTTFRIINSLFSDVGHGVATPLEERLFMALSSSAKVLGDDWPSTFRNVVNYRPGFAYTAPRFRSEIDTFNYLATNDQSIEGLVDRLENSNIAMRSNPSVTEQPKVAAKMLVDVTLILSMISHDLHEEVVDRSGIDRRWVSSKRRFGKMQGLFSGENSWPC